MARQKRHSAAQRKRAELETRMARERSERLWPPAVIGDGVRAIAQDLEPHVTPGTLYWTAPFAYVAEQAAPRLVRMAEMPAGREDDVAAYLHAALNEYLVALVEGFDRAHFEAWIAAQNRQVSGEVMPGE